MMTSKLNNAKEAFVWIWLPGEEDPVVAGKLVEQNKRYDFTYGKSYRERKNAIPLSPFELPLEAGTFSPVGINDIHSCLRDSGPDAWGRQLINFQYPKLNPNELDYLLLSGSDRIGALDFQQSAEQYLPRDEVKIHLEAINDLADIIEKGKSYTKTLAPALLHGTSVGGARPKCLIDYKDSACVAKFSLSTDYYPIIKAEYIAMHLAKLVGINVADVEYKKYLGRDVLLVKRFDRSGQDEKYRHLMLSALSLLELNEMEARYASYQDLADLVRKSFVNPKESLTELFKRLAFNVLVGNTDDHARNHSAFWDGAQLSFTPAYDICPQQRVGHEASQAMAINGNEGNASTLINVLSIHEKFLLNKIEATDIINNQIDMVKKYWTQLCEDVELNETDRSRLWGNVVCSEYSLQGWGF